MILLLEDQYPAEVSSKPDLTHLNQPFMVLSITFRQVCWGKLEQNDAEYCLSGAGLETPVPRQERFIPTYSLSDQHSAVHHWRNYGAWLLVLMTQL